MAVLRILDALSGVLETVLQAGVQVTKVAKIIRCLGEVVVRTVA
jgi:hypothetical protein